MLLENKKNIEVHKNKISDIEKFIEEVQGQKLASINAAADVKSEELKYKTLFEQNNIKRAELNKRILQNKTENSVLTENMTTHKKAYDEITEKIDALDVTGISLQNTLNELTKQNQNVQKEHSDIQQKYHMENSRLNSLKNMTERYEGFGQSIKHVMERKGDTPGIIGVVADIIRVKKNMRLPLRLHLEEAYKTL